MGGTTIDKPTSSIVAISEAVRMGRMHPDGPKRVKIVLGGWSDYARIGSVANGEELAKVMGKFVAHTFADGVDLDLEHLTPYDRMGDEFDGLVAFINAMRGELDSVASNWASNAAAKKAAMQKEYDSLEDWKKTNVNGKVWMLTSRLDSMHWTMAMVEQFRSRITKLTMKERSSGPELVR